VGSSTTATPAIDAATGIDPGCVGIWFINGDVIGMGGAGGDGGVDDEFGYGDYGGGGGGGAGYAGGAGGSVLWASATAGSVGGAWPTTTGGSNGAGALIGPDPSPGTTANDVAPGVAGVGGDAVTLNHQVTIYLSGTIGGGGGGGAGGWAHQYPFTHPAGTFFDGASGGDLGVAGGDGDPTSSPPDLPALGGAAGYAIRYSGSGSATINIVGSGQRLGLVG